MSPQEIDLIVEAIIPFVLTIVFDILIKTKTMNNLKGFLSISLGISLFYAGFNQFYFKRSSEDYLLIFILILVFYTLNKLINSALYPERDMTILRPLEKLHMIISSISYCLGLFMFLYVLMIKSVDLWLTTGLSLMGLSWYFLFRRYKKQIKF